jgi:hypothetical protein
MTEIPSSQWVADRLAIRPCQGVAANVCRVPPHLSSSTYLLSTAARVSLDAANNKIAQADLTTARRAEHIHLGIPAYRDIAAATLTTPGDRHAR